MYLGGFHPALALVPIVPFMPHATRDIGLFDPRERLRWDTLNRFEHWWAIPVQLLLLFFGLSTAVLFAIMNHLIAARLHTETGYQGVASGNREPHPAVAEVASG